MRDAEKEEQHPTINVQVKNAMVRVGCGRMNTGR
jgi:hypothetical protein